MLVTQYTYDAWGSITNVSGALSSTIGTINGLRYRGYYYDTETGYYYLQSRYYNPEFSRFINADDAIYIGESGTTLSINAFAYCENNSISYIDVDGSRRKPRVTHKVYLDKALSYARKWWNSRNPKFYYKITEKNGDCANFVSQCLNAAGFPMDAKWYYYNYWLFGWHKLKVSTSWGSAHGLYSYLKEQVKKNNRAIEYIVIKSTKDLNAVIKEGKYGMGCVAFHMKKNNPNIAGHAMFVGRTTKNNMFFWAHSTNRNGD